MINNGSDLGEEMESTCKICQKEYNMKSLYEDFANNGISSEVCNIDDNRKIEQQLEMQICGECRIKNPPCRGCLGCCQGVETTPCIHCLYFGFTHSKSWKGRCLFCAY